VTEETLLWCVVPTVASPGHGLAKVGISKKFSEFFTGVVTALVAVDKSFRFYKRGTMLFDELMDCLRMFLIGISLHVMILYKVRGGDRGAKACPENGVSHKNRVQSTGMAQKKSVRKLRF
jgi:hypothetical protein